MNPLLYGHNPDEHVIAVQQLNDTTVRMYRRSEGKILHTDMEFFPFFFLSDPSYLSDFPSKYWMKQLDGKNFYQNLCAFPKWSEMWEAVRHVLERYNKTSSNKASTHQDLPVLHLRSDPTTQFLMQSGYTLFKGMEFEDLHRMQLDIETYFKRPSRRQGISPQEERIILIALSDNRGWQHMIDGRKLSEKEMLQELVRLVLEKDPDVIEGHNIFNFDLPYILRRCDHHGIELNVGRDGSSPKRAERRLPATTFPWEQTIEINGRHIIDTLLLLKSYDMSKKDLESYGLKYAAQYFGITPSNRTYIRGDQIWWYWDNEPDKLIRYAMDDVYETCKLSEILSPSTFYLTQMVPMSYGTVAKVGAASKIESLLLREYVRQKHSVPKPQVGSQQTGGYADIFYTGIVGPIVYADVESLYPSIMIGEQIAPETDELKVFPKLLKQLTEMRLDAKRQLKQNNNAEKRSRWDALQSSYKILINSFYGYLGYNRGLFNDYRQADTITTIGQKILRMLIDEILRRNGKVIEVDTDGIYFVPPPDVQSTKKEELFLEQISKNLPSNIRLNIDGRYKKMLSYKKKNYALMDSNGHIITKGSSLVSRSIDRFGRMFIEQCIKLLLEGRFEDIHRLFTTTHNNIVDHKLEIGDLARTETLRDTREQYEKDVMLEKRNRSASYEAAIAAGLGWKSGTKVSYYITGNETDIIEFKNCKLADEWDSNFPDENIPHYLKRLDEFAKKFESFFLPQDFRRIFSLDDLFDFSSAGIGVVTSQVQPEASSSVEEEEKGSFDFPIWLDREEEKPS